MVAVVGECGGKWRLEGVTMGPEGGGRLVQTVESASHTVVYYKLLVDMYLVHSIESCAGEKG